MSDTALVSSSAPPVASQTEVETQTTGHLLTAKNLGYAIGSVLDWCKIKYQHTGSLQTGGGGFSWYDQLVSIVAGNNFSTFSVINNNSGLAGGVHQTISTSYSHNIIALVVYYDLFNNPIVLAGNQLWGAYIPATDITSSGWNDLTYYTQYLGASANSFPLDYYKYIYLIKAG